MLPFDETVFHSIMSHSETDVHVVELLTLKWDPTELEPLGGTGGFWHALQPNVYSGLVLWFPPMVQKHAELVVQV